MFFLSFPSHLILISSLFILLKCDQLIPGSVQSIFNPNIVMKNCTIDRNCTGTINSTTVHYYSMEYTFDPNAAIRITTDMVYSPYQTAPILVVVRQIRGVLSWTLPYEFPNGMIYSSVSRILCPHNEVNRSHPHTSTIFIEISTSNSEFIDYSIQLDNITSYVLEPYAKQEISFSPAKPVYYKVMFPLDTTNIFMTMESGDDFCAVVSAQSFNCPVYDVSEIGIKQGHYQTMSRSASMNVYSDEITKNNQFLLVFAVKPTDTDCLDFRSAADISPTGIVDIQRTKNMTVTLTSPTTVNSLYATIFATSGVFVLLYFIIIAMMCRYQDIYEDFDPSHIPLEETVTEQEMTDQSLPIPSVRTFEGQESVLEVIPTSLSRQSSTIEVITTLRRGFVTVDDLCVKDYEYLQQKFRIYPTTMITIAIFYSLPVIQLVLQYQINIDSLGNEDICYFNFLCTRELFSFTAFNNIFSNVGYLALGILFFIIVYRRDKAYTRFLARDSAFAKEYGVPQHFGLFYAMSVGLMMEGIMSACYHVCPSRQNFQFDTSFMFIIAVLNLIKIYQTRHPDINPHSARAFAFLAMVIFITVIGVYFDQQWFWISYAIVHIILCFLLTTKIYYMNRLKFSLKIHIYLYRLVRENGFLSRPRYLNRTILLILANFVNIGFAVFGAARQPESFPNHLLFVFLANLALYLFYYISMKVIHRERFTHFAKASLLFAMVFWSSSLVFFYNEVKSYEVQPAISRTMNQKCILFDTYDAHDIWHLLSSFGMFFSFLSILTIDDGVRTKRRKNLAAF